MLIDHLYEFAELARQLNFTAAAKALHITQPGLSNHIQTLEQEMGVKLIERPSEGRPARLTAAGEYFLDCASKMIALYEETCAGIERIRKQTTSRLAVRLPRQEYSHPFIDYLVEFMKENPQVKVVAEQWGTGDAVTDLLGEAVDLMCLGAYVSAPGMSERLDAIAFVPCARIECGAWLDTSHPLAQAEALTPAMLGDYELTIPANRQHDLWEASMRSFMAANGVTCRINERYCGSLEDFIMTRVQADDVVLADARLSMMPAFSIRPERVIVPFTPMVTLDNMVAYRKDDDNPALRTFVDFLSAKVQADDTLVRFR